MRPSLHTETVMQSVFLFFNVPVWDFRNAETLPQNLFYPSSVKPRMYICLHSTGLLEYPRKFGFRTILGRLRSILWRFVVISHCGAIEPDVPLVLLHLRTEFGAAHLLGPLKIWQLWFPKSCKDFMKPPPIPLLHRALLKVIHSCFPPPEGKKRKADQYESRLKA